MSSRKKKVPVRERETRQQGRQTIAKLIEVGTIELNRKGSEKFDLESVLKKSRISKGSLYHHFASRGGFIAAIETELFRQQLSGGNEQLRELVAGCKSAQDLLSLLEIAIKLTGQPENRELRQKRIRAMAFAQHNQELAQSIKENQIAVTTYLTDTFKIAQDRGWIKPETNLLAMSYLIQGLYFGHLILDSTQIQDLDDHWNQVAVTALRSFLVL